MRELDVSRYRRVPYKEKGRSMEGWDCFGLLWVIFRDFTGVELPLFLEDYQNVADTQHLQNLIEGNKGMFIKVERPKPLDFILINIVGEPVHCGLFIGRDKFIHCRKATGTVISSVNDHKWKDRIVEYRRYH